MSYLLPLEKVFCIAIEMRTIPAVELMAAANKKCQCSNAGMNILVLLSVYNSSSLPSVFNRIVAQRSVTGLVADAVAQPVRAALGWKRGGTRRFSCPSGGT